MPPPGPIGSTGALENAEAESAPAGEPKALNSDTTRREGVLGVRRSAEAGVPGGEPMLAPTPMPPPGPAETRLRGGSVVPVYLLPRAEFFFIKEWVRRLPSI